MDPGFRRGDGEGSERSHRFTSHALSVMAGLVPAIYAFDAQLRPTHSVIPAKAGIHEAVQQSRRVRMDPGLRRSDGEGSGERRAIPDRFSSHALSVMAGLVPAIHVLDARCSHTHSVIPAKAGIHIGLAARREAAMDPGFRRGDG
jgi:hypothetical protein